MDFVYIMACQRGQGLPEIFSMWDSYEKAITAYYNYHIKDGYAKREDSSDYWFMYLYKFPLNQLYCDETKWSDIKMGKSCKYRIKFKNWGELKKEYISVNRDNKLTEIGI